LEKKKTGKMDLGWGFLGGKVGPNFKGATGKGSFEGTSVKRQREGKTKRGGANMPESLLKSREAMGALKRTRREGPKRGKSG